MKYRTLELNEYGLLKDFLYEAIYIPEGAEAPDRSIIELPELALYYEGFGNEESPNDEYVHSFEACRKD